MPAPFQFCLFAFTFSLIFIARYETTQKNRKKATRNTGGER
jgi:hypothetical protein